MNPYVYSKGPKRLKEEAASTAGFNLGEIIKSVLTSKVNTALAFSLVVVAAGSALGLFSIANSEATDLSFSPVKHFSAQSQPKVLGESISPRAGQLVLINSTVFLVGETGLYGVPNLAVFNSWGWHFSQVAAPNSAEAALRQVWIVPMRNPICNSPIDQIKGACSSSSAPRVGQTIIISSQATVFLVGDRGLYGIPSLAVFNSWGWSFDKVLTANSAEEALPQVGLVPMRNPICRNVLDQIANLCLPSSTSTSSPVSVGFYKGPFQISSATCGEQITFLANGYSGSQVWLTQYKNNSAIPNYDQIDNLPDVYTLVCNKDEGNYVNYAYAVVNGHKDALLGTAVFTVAPLSTGSILLGDANLDGQVTIADSLKIQLHADGTTLLTGQALANSDVTGEGTVNGIDAILVANYYGGMITQFPKTDGSTLLLGDANRNGTVNIGDSVVIGNHVAGTAKITGRALDNADVDGDGKITNNDATLVANFAGCAITTFPRGTPLVALSCLNATSTPATIGFYKAGMQATSAVCGEQITFVVGGSYTGSQVWLTQYKNNNTTPNYDKIDYVPDTYTLVCNKDEGTYTNYAYTVVNGQKGVLLGSVVFNVLASNAGLFSGATYSFSHNNGNLVAGQTTWTYALQGGNAGDVLAVDAYKNGSYVGKLTVCTVQPASPFVPVGSCMASGTAPTSDIGSWYETVYINNVYKGTVSFSVSAPVASAPSGTPAFYVGYSRAVSASCGTAATFKVDGYSGSQVWLVQYKNNASSTNFNGIYKVPDTYTFVCNKDEGFYANYVYDYSNGQKGALLGTAYFTVSAPVQSQGSTGYTFSHNGGTIVAGRDAWTYTLFGGQPGDKLEAEAYKNGSYVGKFTVCVVPAATTSYVTGSCQASATPQAGDIGNWSENVYINGVWKGMLSFSVSA